MNHNTGLYLAMKEAEPRARASRVPTGLEACVWSGRPGLVNTGLAALFALPPSLEADSLYPGVNGRGHLTKFPFLRFIVLSCLPRVVSSHLLSYTRD